MVSKAQRTETTADVPVTDLLAAWRGGNEAAREELFQRIYSELRRLAAAQVHIRSATMAPTELVHEAYLKLVGVARIGAKDREHFYSQAAQAMRHILVDTKRRQHAAKRGGATPPATLDDRLVGRDGSAQDELLALDSALRKLEALDERLVRIVELRHFGGFSVEQTAEALELSPRTVKRHWRSARAFLYDQLSPKESRKE